MKAERPRNLAFGVGAIGRHQMSRQFHLLCCFQLPNNPCTFFRISFCTVNSPMILLRSSGDSPGAYPWACALAFGLRLSPKSSGRFFWNSSLQRWIIELETPYFLRTSSIVVSRCKLSKTTFALNSGVYCFLLYSAIHSPYLSGSLFLPYPLVKYSRYWTDMFRNKQLQLNVNLENIQTIYFIFNLSLQH